MGASTCLNIPEASRSIDLRFCLDGASAAYFHDSYSDLIVSGSPYYQFAKGKFPTYNTLTAHIKFRAFLYLFFKGIGLLNNVTDFNPVRKTDATLYEDYSLLGQLTYRNILFYV